MTYECMVFFDSEAGVWVGLCDAIPVATEAASYDGLVDRVWQIAPEILAENGHPAPHDARIRFVNETTAPRAAAAL